MLTVLTVYFKMSARKILNSNCLKRPKILNINFRGKQTFIKKLLIKGVNPQILEVSESLESILKSANYPAQCRSSRPEVFCKKGVLRNFAKLTGRPEACNLIKKETLAQVFFCEFCEIFKNTFLTEHFWATASVSGSFEYLCKFKCLIDNFSIDIF